MSSTTLRHLAVLLALSLLLTFASACAKEEEAPPEPEVAERVENAQVGVAIADLPEVFRVDLNEGQSFELVPTGEGVEGRLVIAAGPPETGGINLVDAIEKHSASFAERPGGQYKGQRELGSNLGTAFYSRGNYDRDDGTTMEETVIFLVHPWQDRTLELIYRYPSGEDSGVRIEEHMFAILGELEPLPAPEEAG